MRSCRCEYDGLYEMLRKKELAHEDVQRGHGWFPVRIGTESVLQSKTE